MQSKKVNKNDILKLFKQSGKPLDPKDIYSQLATGKKSRNRIKNLLDQMVHEGRLIRSGKALCLVDMLPMLKGTLEIQRAGMGFVIPEDKRRRDVFIHPSKLEDARHGDTVLTAIIPGKRGKNHEGRIVRVLKRAVDTVTAKTVKPIGKEGVLVRPTDPRHQFSMIIENVNRKQTEPGLVVVARPMELIQPGLWSAEMVREIGDEESFEVQEKLVKYNHGIPTDFPSEVMEEAVRLPSVPNDADMEKRRDLTTVGFVTIDGAKARDFDDAIHVKKTKNGYKLMVAIADVAHYVRPGSNLDCEARARGNSYYFPMSVEPMFPEELSNGLCSLNPDEPRLAMVAEMDFDRRGEAGDSAFYPATIKSHKRLTYSQVHSAVEKQEKKTRKELAPVMDMLDKAADLARILVEKRRLRGGLDFDLPEPEVVISQYAEDLEVREKKRFFAHQLIEEFMIAANEAVASFLERNEGLFLYRVHPEPDEDKLESLFTLLGNTSLADKLPEKADVKGLQSLLQAAEDTNLEFLVNRLMLRCMMQAFYSPVNQGHFGLASESYCHFTSPIRRYADLVVHRALKAFLSAKEPEYHKLQKLKEVGEDLSSLERKGMEAEREILKRASIIALKDRVGESFTGVICSLADHGFWVELQEVMAEGMVRLSSLSDDYYTFWPEKQEILGQRTGRTFCLGQEIRVQLTRTDLDRLQVDLEVK
ncbi:MAG: ribonuclease R [Desulfonatronovibrionaceae bacterium]